MAGTTPRDQFDTSAIRTLFRRIVSVGALMIGAICAVHTGVLLWHGIPLWWSSAAVGVLALLLRPCFAPEKPFPVFLAATVGMAGAGIANTIHLSVQAGADAGFHFVIFALVPVAMVSGRIRARTKWWIAATLIAAVVAIEWWAPRLGASLVADPAKGRQVVAALMALNLAGIGLAIAALMSSYFHLVGLQQSRLQELVVRDPLTGMFNRRFAYEASQAMQEGMSRHRQDFAVIMADLDHFKSINDLHGHDVGDEALKHAAELLRQCARAGDVHCRWGGEELLLLLPQTNEVAAMACAERMRSTLDATPLAAQGINIHVTATFGVATARYGDSLDSMVDRVDKALYEGKRLGRNRVVASRPVA